MISKELILEGAKFRKDVHITVYDENIVVRPLTELEIAKVFKKVEESGFETTDPKLSDNYLLYVETCRYGIVDPKLHEIVNPEDPVEKQKEIYELMTGNALTEIGKAITSISTVDSKELSDFFKNLKDKSCSGSTMLGTESQVG